MDSIEPQIKRILPEVVELRRELHAHPELSRREFETARRLRQALSRLPNLTVLPPLLETDVVAVLNPDRAGPCIALRADLDALPIDEATNVPYKSKVAGVMHACGHDGHTAILLGTAMILSQSADSLPGKVKFIFQPDEEDRGGGGELCRRGVLDAPKVNAAVALHAWPYQPLGAIVVRRGSIMAASTTFAVTIRGQGAHGAYPHRGIDPIVVAAHVITALQTIVSRNVAPQDAAVVTVGQVSAGSATNIIPPECTMRGTLRYVRPETGELVRQRLSTVAGHTARAHGAEAAIEFSPGYPPMVNDPDLARFVETVGRGVLGPQQVVTDEPISMGVEDFAFYAQQVPSVMFRLGLRPPGAESYPSLHSPQFDFNDDALPVGIRLFREIAARFLAAQTP